MNTTNVQHEKLEFQMVQPFIEGFSVKSIKDDAMETDDPPPENVDPPSEKVESPPTKRTQTDSQKKNPKKKKN